MPKHLKSGVTVYIRPYCERFVGEGILSRCDILHAVADAWCNHSCVVFTVRYPALVLHCNGSVPQGIMYPMIFEKSVIQEQTVLKARLPLLMYKKGTAHDIQLMSLGICAFRKIVVEF
jgi:hypothetical protein